MVCLAEGALRLGTASGVCRRQAKEDYREGERKGQCVSWCSSSKDKAASV